MREFSFPWKHSIVDNQFSDQLFSIVRSYACNIKRHGDEHITMLSAIVSDGNVVDRGESINGDIYSTGLMSLMSVDDIKLIHGHFTDICDGKRMQIQLVCTWGDYEYQKHTDNKSKEITVCTYIYPDDGIGTRLYLSKDDKFPAKIIYWIPNTSIVFSREEDVTWHDYVGSGDMRVVLNVSVLSDD